MGEPYAKSPSHSHGCFSFTCNGILTVVNNGIPQYRVRLVGIPLRGCGDIDAEHGTDQGLNLGAAEVAETLGLCDDTTHSGHPSASNARELAKRKCRGHLNFRQSKAIPAISATSGRNGARFKRIPLDPGGRGDPIADS